MLADQPQWIQDRRQLLGDRVRSARLHANRTQENLAHAAGIDRSTLQRIETGTNDARVSHLWLIAAALEVPVAELIAE